MRASLIELSESFIKNRDIIKQGFAWENSYLYPICAAIFTDKRKTADVERMKECRDMLVDLNERLDKKAYEAAKLYYKMEDYLASRVAFRNVIKDDAENVYREDILYYIAMSSYKYAYLSVPSKQKER